ncbi:MAG TPA: c-type cytochrome [Burkholderiales bacterium]|nr:c-type cytochrome [Burkholderiales bacterium]
MRKLIGMAVIAGCFALAATAQAQSGAELAKSKGCLNCHAINQKKMGASFNEIATKNKGNSNAEAQLIAMLKNAKGHPKVALSDAEAKALIQYVLKQ